MIGTAAVPVENESKRGEKTMFEKTKKFCDSFLKTGVPGFDLEIRQKGERILRYSNGYSDLENRIPINGRERYNIYSCSKVITCTAAMQLWEKGLFSLDDRLSEYMPEFGEMTVKTEDGVKKAENPILIHHLFEMTAGLAYETASPEILQCRKDTDGRCPTREVMKYLARKPLSFEPGAHWQYSFCHDVIAALVEVWSGEKFEDYVKKHIFDVVGMERSTFMLPEEEIDSIAEQYSFRDGKPVNVGKHILFYKLGTEYASGGAGCISTVDDYMRFLEGLRTGVFLKPETVRLMATDRLTPAGRLTYTKAATHGYGLGLRCPKEGGKERDFGWGGAASAYLAIEPEKEISLYFACHMLASPIRGVRSQILRFALAEMYDPAAIPQIEKELETLHSYNLTY